MAFDWKKPTAQMLGRWQPWHKGHSNLFKKALEQTGQVAIMVRDVGGIIGQDAGGGRTVKQDDNPFDFNFVSAQIILNLQNEGFTINEEYVIMEVPNMLTLVTVVVLGIHLLSTILEKRFIRLVLPISVKI